jgi:hypothetical protein
MKRHFSVYIGSSRLNTPPQAVVRDLPKHRAGQITIPEGPGLGQHVDVNLIRALQR